MRNYFAVAAATSAALVISPTLLLATPIAGGATIKYVASAIPSAEKTQYWGYRGWGYGGWGYNNYYRPYYGYQPYGSYYNYSPYQYSYGDPYGYSSGCDPYGECSR